MTAALSDHSRRLDRLKRIAACFVFAAGVGIFAFTTASDVGAHGLWYDEYWTLYLADPATPLLAFAYDVHPPLYAGLVRIAVALGLTGAAALITVNLVTISATAALGFWIALRSRGLNFAFVIFGIVFASAPVLTFALEGRDYIFAQLACVALTMAVLGGSMGSLRLNMWVFIALAVLCGSVHLYAAIYAGAIGVGLITLGLIHRRRQDIIVGFAIGAGTTAVTVVWVIIARQVMFDEGMNWIPSGTTYITGQFWYASKMLGGATPNVALFLAAVGICFFSAAARPYAILLAVTSMIFVGLPTLVSIVKPMLHGRYLTIAIPSILALGATTIIEAVRAAPARRLNQAAGVVGVLFFAISLSASPSVARHFIAEKWTYDPASVRAALSGCPDPRLRVVFTLVVAPDRAYLNGADVHLYSYRTSLGIENVRFDVSTESTADIADYPCRAVGWAEHFIGFNPDTPALEQALKILNLTNKGNVSLTLQERPHGFLLLRR